MAELLPNRTLPELLFLETKWASLMSYGMTSDLLQEVLPIDELVNTFTIRRHVANVAERLEAEALAERFEHRNVLSRLHRIRGMFLTAMDAGESRADSSPRYRSPMTFSVTGQCRSTSNAL